jgi:hypothetical protein
MTDDQYYNLDKNAEPHTCCLCECDPKVHLCYFKCPIFEQNDICADCCLLDALRPGIEKKFSEKLGREITREEIDKMCKECGRNHATEDGPLAIELENNSPQLQEPDGQTKQPPAPEL